MAADRTIEDDVKFLAIDPGNIYSGYVVMQGLNVLEKGKIENDILIHKIREDNLDCEELVVEQIKYFGMPAGDSIHDTSLWSGRFIEAFDNNGGIWLRYPRKTIVTHLCSVSTAKDGNVIQALIDRFAPNTPNKGKGVKARPGFFYGFAGDIWQAFALGVFYYDLKKGGK